MASANFTNTSSSQENEACNILDNSLPVKTGQIMTFSIILLSSFVGNILLIITVYKREELRKTINYFIVNMAVSDLVYPLTAIPVELTQIATGSGQWPIRGVAGLIVCKLENFLQHVSAFVSVESLVWIALDRFVAVVFPMKAHLISSRFRAFAIASTWIVAMVINSSDLYAYGLVQTSTETFCSHLNTAVFSFMNDGKVHVYVVHIAPLITLTILYCAVAVTLRRQDKSLRCAVVRQKYQRKRQAIKMSFCVMTAFCICNLPMALFNIVQESEIPMSCALKKPFSFLSDLLFFLSSTVNPIICFSFVASYRRGLKEISNASLGSCCSRRSARRNIETDRQDDMSLRRIRQ